jgi:nitroreductase
MVLDVILKRRSVRQFKKDPIPKEKIIDLIKAAQFAPTAMNNASVEFIIIEDQKIKSDIYEVCEPKQDFVKDAPILIVPFIHSKKSVTPIPDLSLASQNIFLQATALGLGTVWKNLPPHISNKVKKICEIPEEYVLINLIPVGVPKSIPQSHSENEFSEKKIYSNRFKQEFK